MSEPYTLQVGPHRFAVVSNPQVTKQLIRDGKYGETDVDRLTLNIRGDLPASLWDETLYHELLHAILAITGMAVRLGEQLEEEVVAAIAPMLTHAIRVDTMMRGAVK